MLQDLEQVGYYLGKKGELRKRSDNNNVVQGIDLASLHSELKHLGYKRSKDPDSGKFIRLYNDSGLVLDLDTIQSLYQEITAIKGSYLDSLGIDINADDYQPNYALKIEKNQTLTHNRFVVPDWGVLRFDLHVPNPDDAGSTNYNNRVRVFLDDQELKSSAFQELTTFITSNILPMPQNVNKRWGGLETYLTDLVYEHNKEVYIIAGGDEKPFGKLNDKIIIPKNIWKIVLILDKPGLGISDVTENALAFGIYLPNTQDYTENGDRDRIRNLSYPWRYKFNFNDKEVGLFDVRTLEEKTGYNFFSNIPTEIQDAIESRSIEDIEAKLNEIDTLSASLMAATDEISSSSITTVPPLRPFYDSSFRHRGAPNQIQTSTNQPFIDMSPFEVSLSENSILESANLNFSEDSTAGIHEIQVASSQISFIEATPMQVGSTQISIANNCSCQRTTIQENSTQVGSSQIDSIKQDFAKVSSSQINIAQNNSFEIDSTYLTKRNEIVTNQLNTSEITLPVIIPNQQFFGSDLPNHNLTSNFVSNINSSATNIWEDLLNPETPLNINFQITDLPTGQLAEAQITSFDSHGRPNAGNILIDHNANDRGWFIDTTPFDNSEFSRQNTE